jgi:hypothetical protein
VAISLKIYEGPLQDLNKIGHKKRVGQLITRCGYFFNIFIMNGAGFIVLEMK